MNLGQRGRAPTGAIETTPLGSKSTPLGFTIFLDICGHYALSFVLVHTEKYIL